MMGLYSVGGRDGSEGSILRRRLISGCVRPLDSRKAVFSERGALRVDLCCRNWDADSIREVREELGSPPFVALVELSELLSE